MTIAALPTFDQFFRVGFASIVAGAAMVMSGAVSALEYRLEPRAVVELFTSQGCSSCPPADRLLRELTQDEDILALAYHVDYWDYIGWADTFAKPEFSAYQRDYAKCWNKDRVYTPQMVVNGKSGVVGSRRAEVADKLRDAKLPLAMSLHYEDGVARLHIDPSDQHEAATLWLVTYIGEAEVEIERGENRGNTYTYSQVVTSRQALGMWSPENGLQVDLPIRDILDAQSDGLALIVQQDVDGLPGAIISAAALKL